MYALIYLDNVIVFSHTKEEHLHRLRVVFGRFLEHGLKLKPEPESDARCMREHLETWQVK